MRVFYAEANYDDEEIQAAVDVLTNSRHSLMGGSKVTALEAAVAKLYRKSFCTMVNSGSSANLLGIRALRLTVGSKVITPALTFSTTVSPIVQAGLKPLFLDCDEDTLQLSVDQLSEVDLSGVSAIVVPNLIGNLADWKNITAFARQNNLKIVEDSADTIGYQTNVKGDWSDVSTTSFYASHVVTGAGFGGAVAFQSEEDNQYAKSLRGWGRRSSQYGETEDYTRRFNCKVDGLDYDDKYVFDDLGYNLIPSEISAAFALVQLNKLEANITSRIENFSYMEHNLKDYPEYKTMKSYEGVKTGWLAFPIILQGKLEGQRKKLQIFLEQHGVQTRTIFTGNITRQPVAEKFEWEACSNLDNSDYIMKNGILLGCHNRLTREQMDYVLELLSDFLKQK